MTFVVNRFAVFLSALVGVSTLRAAVPTAATSIQRRCWTKVALTVVPGEAVTLFVDGEILGKSAMSGKLPPLESLRFGGDPRVPWKLLHGALASLRIHAGLTHDTVTAKTARGAAVRRLRRESRERWAATLPPEEADWATRHPRLILPPGRLAEVRDQLTKGRGPELLQRLLADCHRWTDPGSPAYYAPATYELQQDRYVVMTPALLALGTLLSDEPSYARRAGEIAAAYAEAIGYDDLAGYLAASAYAAGTTMMMALVYDWGYAAIDPAHREAIREGLVEIAAEAYDMFEAEGIVYRKWAPNWTAMAVSTLGHACLAVIGETNAPVRKWLNLATHVTLIQGNSAVDRAGAFHEGAHYFFYGDQHILVFLEALRTATGDDLLQRTNSARIPDMEQPVILALSDTQWRLRWRHCEDRIFLNTQGTISESGIVSDAELVVLRLRRDKLIGWVLVGGTYLDWASRRVIELEGGAGSALFAAGELSLSGRRVTGFRARLGRQLKRIIAHGTSVSVRRSGSVWSAVAPLLHSPGAHLVTPRLTAAWTQSSSRPRSYCRADPQCGPDGLVEASAAPWHGETT